MAMRCNHIVSQIVDDFSKRHSYNRRAISDRVEQLEQYCNAINDAARVFNGESISSYVDEQTEEVHISICCPEILIETTKHPFYEVLEHAVTCEFSSDENGNLVVDMSFSSVWETPKGANANE